MQGRVVIAWSVYILSVLFSLAVGFVYMLPKILGSVGVDLDGKAELVDIIMIFTLGSTTLIFCFGLVAVLWLLSLRVLFGKEVAKEIFYSGPTTKLDRPVFSKLVE